MGTLTTNDLRYKDILVVCLKCEYDAFVHLAKAPMVPNMLTSGRLKKDVGLAASQNKGPLKQLPFGFPLAGLALVATGRLE